MRYCNTVIYFCIDTEKALNITQFWPNLWDLMFKISTILCICLAKDKKIIDLDDLHIKKLSYSRLIPLLLMYAVFGSVLSIQMHHICRDKN